MPFRKEIISRDFPHLFNQMAFVRSFDFFFWDFMFMCHAKVKPEHMFLELKRIFKQENFIKSLTFKQMHGIKLKNFNSEQLDHALQNFVDRGIHTFGLLKANKLDRKINNSIFKLFGEIFCDINYSALSTTDLLAQSCFFENEIKKEFASSVL